MNPSKYTPKPGIIEAMKITPENFRELAEWCGGSSFGGGITRALECIHFDNPGGTVAFRGDWVIKFPNGQFATCDDDQFHENWEPAPPLDHPAGTGAQAITAERERQIEAEGFTPEMDDENISGELTEAAICYASAAVAQVDGSGDGQGKPAYWPWFPEWWKPSVLTQRNLAKAGALLAAEWDRLERLAMVMGTVKAAEADAGLEMCSVCHVNQATVAPGYCDICVPF